MSTQWGWWDCVGHAGNVAMGEAVIQTRTAVLGRARVRPRQGSQGGDGCGSRPAGCLLPYSKAFQATFKTLARLLGLASAVAGWLPDSIERLFYCRFGSALNVDRRAAADARGSCGLCA